MSPEPKKPIEELLEASARARRAEFGADPKMPNPMRAQLHEEIARLNPGEETKARRNWFAMFWPQISLATAVAVVLVTTSVVWFRNQTKPSDTSLQLAMNAPAPRNESNATLSLDEAVAPSLADSPASSANEPTKASSDVAQAPTAARAFAAVPHQPEITNQAQRFSQAAAGKLAARAQAKAKQSANVLKTFDVTQEGDKIRVVDEDGSTYTGKLEQVAQSDVRSLNSKTNRQAGLRAAPAAQSPVQNQSNEYFFRAVGLNASLKKPVVFEANYVATPAENQQNALSKDALPNEQTRARIVGTAKIPGEPPVEVDAVSVAH